MKILITGAAGFIGSHLFDKFVEEKFEVMGVDDLSRGIELNIEHHFKKISKKRQVRYIDISSPAMEEVFQSFKPDYVLHQAAIPGVSISCEQPFETDRVNIGGTVNLLKLSRDYKVKRFVFASSSSVYGGSEELPTPETALLNPKSPYALQKKTCEDYIQLFSTQFGLDGASLRYFNVFGPRQLPNGAYSSVITAFLQAEANRKKAVIYGDGLQFRDMTYISNVVDANFKAITTSLKLNGEKFNIGCGETSNILKIHSLICTSSPEHAEYRAGDVKCSMADIKKAEQYLGYKPNVSFEEGLCLTKRWWEQNPPHLKGFITK